MFATHVSFHLIPNVQIVRTFQNRIPIQMFEKWHTIDIRITYKLQTNDLKMTDKILNYMKDLEFSDLIFKFFYGKIIALGGCK